MNTYDTYCETTGCREMFIQQAADLVGDVYDDLESVIKLGTSSTLGNQS